LCTHVTVLTDHTFNKYLCHLRFPYILQRHRCVNVNVLVEKVLQAGIPSTPKIIFSRLLSQSTVTVIADRLHLEWTVRGVVPLSHSSVCVCVCDVDVANDVLSSPASAAHSRHIRRPINSLVLVLPAFSQSPHHAADAPAQHHSPILSRSLNAHRV